MSELPTAFDLEWMRTAPIHALVFQAARVIPTLVDALTTAEARADAAERECAELHDALDAARMVIDEVQARQRGQQQACAWAKAAAAVQQATDRSSA